MMGKPVSGLIPCNHATMQLLKKAPGERDSGSVGEPPKILLEVCCYRRGTSSNGQLWYTGKQARKIHFRLVNLRPCMM